MHEQIIYEKDCSTIPKTNDLTKYTSKVDKALLRAITKSPFFNNRDEEVITHFEQFCSVCTKFAIFQRANIRMEILDTLDSVKVYIKKKNFSMTYYDIVAMNGITRHASEINITVSEKIDCLMTLVFNFAESC